jgi:hypothetical protein
MAREFRLWGTCCAHVTTDIQFGRESLADPIRQSEFGGDEGGPAFDWDIALNLGDFTGARYSTPVDEEGEEVVRQFGVMKKHRREQVYTLCGNHDRNAPDDTEAWWFRKWVDPIGENTETSGVDPAKMPFPVEGSWERYRFSAGNLMFLMMSDVNETTLPHGRGERGGCPAGVVSQETFDWWKEMVDRFKGDYIIVTAHHYVLKETTVASGQWEGFSKDENGNWVQEYHRYYPDAAPEGASYLHWVGHKPDSGAFEEVLQSTPGATDLWLGGHTHTDPDDTRGGRTHVETKWNTHFVNVSALTRFHGEKRSRPISRLFTFTDGSDEVKVQCYMHTSEHKPQGWYDAVERTLKLSRPFQAPEGD